MDHISKGSSSTLDGLMLNTVEMLDEEKQTILSEVLKCAVCLELPKRKQVLICEEGHHFCSTCHKKLKICGICRGKLLESRNFVVEELVMKLGPILGISKNELPMPEPPMKYTSGTYQCQHQCLATVPSYQMLPHLRANHSTHLIDNMRTNPYTNQFSWTYDLTFAPNTNYALSAQISDMGLFTILTNFNELDFFGCVKVLGDKSVSVWFRYQLTVIVSSKHALKPVFQFSVADCPVASYYDDVELINSLGNLLKVRGCDLLEYLNVGSTLSIYFSVWRKIPKGGKKKSCMQSMALAPEKPLVFYNDRKVRRNKHRNIRRKRLKEKMRNLESGENNDLADFLSKLTIKFKI